MNQVLNPEVVPASPSPSLALPLKGEGMLDWRIPLLTGLVLAAVTALPYVYAYAVQPPGHVFMGFFYLGDDANTYLAKMRQGWEGAWAWQNRYTTESSPTAYLFMFWIVLGHIAALLNLPLIVTFHLARVAAAFALMAAAWYAICHFIEDRSARKFAFFFLAAGLGMGYVIQALGQPVIFGHQTDTLDWRMPELTAFYSLLALPHFAWSGVFAAAGIALTLKSIQRGSLVLGVLAGLAWLGQASIHPQMPILMGGATAVALLLRPATPRGWIAGALAFAIPAPYILYSYLAFVGNPEVQRWTFHSKNALPPETISLLFAIAPAAPSLAAGERFALVAEWVVFSGQHESRREPGEVGDAERTGERSGLRSRSCEVLPPVESRPVLGQLDAIEEAPRLGVERRVGRGYDKDLAGDARRATGARLDRDSRGYRGAGALPEQVQPT